MKTTVVKMKNGQEFCSALWEINPKEGYLVLVDGSPLRLSEIESAITKNVWVHWDSIQDVDLLEKAREEGWDGIQ